MVRKQRVSFYKIVMSHHEHDDLEKEYWGNCANTFEEDQKHYIYAKYMQIPQWGWDLDAQNKSVLDIGGGPSSMLLKCINLKKGKVCDPLEYPLWTKYRYISCNIELEVISGESINEKGFDEVWIYNCLQHVDSVEKIIENAKRAAPVLRMFEWIDIPPYPGHPQMLTKKYLDEIIQLPGSETAYVREYGCFGNVYYGVFRQ